MIEMGSKISNRSAFKNSFSSDISNGNIDFNN